MLFMIGSKMKMMMKVSLTDKNSGLMAGAVLFGGTGALHLLRLFTGSQMVLGGHTVPTWGSGVFLAIAWSMAGWYLYLVKKESVRS